MQRHALMHTHTTQNFSARRGLLERAPVSQKITKMWLSEAVCFPSFPRAVWKVEGNKNVKKKNPQHEEQTLQSSGITRGTNQRKRQRTQTCSLLHIFTWSTLEVCLWLDCSEHRQFCGTLPAARALGLAAAPMNPVGVFPLPVLRAGSCPTGGCWQCQLEQLMLACW